MWRDEGDETRGGGRSEKRYYSRRESRGERAHVGGNVLVPPPSRRAIRRSACIRVFMTVRAREA